MPRLSPAPGVLPPPAVAALHSALAGGPVPTALRLLPAGRFAASDGRAEGPWELTDDDGHRLVADMAARQSARYIDYEHATLRAKETGQPAPAAGWFSALEWRAGDGLWAVGIEWTAAAAEHIQGREYRYISPLFSYDPTSGRVLQLLGASLTNDPGLDGLTDLAALAARSLMIPPTTEPRMPDTLKKILAALGLSETADEAAALAAVQALQTNVAALTARLDSPPDPARYVPIASLNAVQAEHAATRTRLAELSAQVRAAELEKVLEAGQAAGKLTPALLGWAREYGTQNLAGLSAYLKDATVVCPPGQTQTGGRSAAASTAAPTGESIAKAALAYQAEQAAAGRCLTTLQAVQHVTQHLSTGA